jgi:hypothetical protein
MASQQHRSRTSRNLVSLVVVLCLLPSYVIGSHHHHHHEGDNEEGGEPSKGNGQVAGNNSNIELVQETAIIPVVEHEKAPISMLFYSFFVSMEKSAG